ncbi:MAG: pitrilysin family protein [Acidobacteriota bacterium]
MRRSAALAILAILLCGTVALSGAADGGRIFPYDPHVEVLDNGLKVILIPMKSEGLVAYWSMVRSGARDEYEPGRTGFAHFFEHMMFQGTEKFPQDRYNEIVTLMGADANGFTTDDLTAYHLAIAAEDLEQVMEIESDRFQRLSYSEPAFKTEAGAVYGEYRKNRMNPFFAVYESIHKAAYQVHTYGHTAMGYEEDIKQMPNMYDYSRSFFSRYYRPDNIMLLIVGDLDVGITMQLVRKYYGAWEAGYVPPKVPAEPEQTAERRIRVEYQGRSLPILWVTYKMDRFDSQDRNMIAADLLIQLAFGETSDIYKELVLDEQVIEFLGADVNLNRDPGLLDIYTRIKDPEKVDYVLDRIDLTVARYQQAPADGGRLEDLKSRLKYEFLMGLDTPDRVASSLARIIAVTGGIEAVNELYGSYETITLREVQDAASRYLVPDHRTVAVLRGGE